MKKRKMRKMIFSAIFVLLVATTLVKVRAQQSPAQSHKHLMMVVEKGLPGATMFDADTGQAICNANVGIMSPHEAAFSLDGKTAYVPVYGSTNVGVPGTDEHVIDFFRTSDCQQIGSLDTGDYKRPHGIWVGRSGTIYVTSEIAQSILLIDPVKRQIIASVPTGSPYTHMFAMTNDEQRAFTSNVMSKTLSLLDIPNRKLIKTVPTQTNNQRMTISPDQKWFVTSLGQEGKVAFYHVADGELDFTVDISDGLPFSGKFSADGLYYEMGSSRRPGAGVGTAPARPSTSPASVAAAAPSLRVWKIDPTSRKVLGTSSEEILGGTGSLAISPFNKDVYVSTLNTNQLVVLDPATLKIIKTIPTEKVDDCIVFAAVQ